MRSPSLVSWYLLLYGGSLEDFLVPCQSHVSFDYLYIYNKKALCQPPLQIFLPSKKIPLHACGRAVCVTVHAPHIGREGREMYVFQDTYLSTRLLTYVRSETC